MFVLFVLLGFVGFGVCTAVGRDGGELALADPLGENDTHPSHSRKCENIPTDEDELVVCKSLYVFNAVNEAVHTCRVNNCIKDMVSRLATDRLIFGIFGNIKAEQSIHTNGLELGVAATAQGLERAHIRALA